MSKSTSERNLEERAQLFKALGHPARLLMMNLIQQKPRHGEELAAILNLKPATVSHHLAKLADAGLLTATKDQYYQMFSLVGDILKKAIGRGHPPVPAQPDGRSGNRCLQTKGAQRLLQAGAAHSLASAAKKAAGDSGTNCAGV